MQNHSVVKQLQRERLADWMRKYFGQHVNQKAATQLGVCERTVASWLSGQSWPDQEAQIKMYALWGDDFTNFINEPARQAGSIQEEIHALRATAVAQQVRADRILFALSRSGGKGADLGGESNLGLCGVVLK